MDQEVKKSIAVVNQYITGFVFEDISVLQRNLLVMKYNTDLEWFNTAIISSKKVKDNQVFAYPLFYWENIFQRKFKINEPCEQDQILLLKPFYDEELHRFDFILMVVYFQTAFSLNNKIYIRKSRAAIAAEKFHFEQNQFHLKKGWQLPFLDKYLRNFRFYYFSPKELKKFYLEILIYTFGSNLLIDFNSEGLSIPDIEFDKIGVYKNIHTLITSFHAAFSQFLKKLEDADRELKERGYYKNNRYFEGYKVLKKMEEGIER